MKTLILLSQTRIRALVARIFLIVAFALPNSAALASQPGQGNAPTFVITAPAQVELGDRIEIQLIVDHAQDLAGYEGQLLFDTSAAHFSGFQQRDSDLKKFGRDVIPLEEGEMTDGVAMGLASCPFQNCVDLKGSPQPKGANGRIRLGSVQIGTDQEGVLELRFDNLKFVDSSGNTIPVDIPQSLIRVQVGSNTGVSFPAPASTWQRSSTAQTTGSSDVTGDGVVNYADAAEVALEWMMSREQGQPCGPANDLSRDSNGDGCIDVSDIQLVLANTTGKDSNPKAGTSGPAAAASSTMDTLAVTAAATAGTFIVNSTSDAPDASIGNGICATSTGDCTLRAAISEANNHEGPDTILFNIPGTGVQTIQLASRLPSLWDGSGGTTIDGYSQPGAQPNTDSLISNAQIMIQLRGNGPGAFDLMQITSAGNVIRGLSTFNACRSIWVTGSAAKNNLIAGNFIGTDATGTFGLATHYLYAYGIEIDNGASNNQVGGTSPADRNVISGNARTGLDFNSDLTDNNVVYNNIIGLNPSGTARLQNLRHGIDMNFGPSYNIIGGTAPGQRNILSGNGEDQNAAYVAGIEISHSTLTSYNSVIGNCFGTDVTCNGATSWSFNRHYGINLEDGVNNNTIANNVIGNNPQGGLRITGSGTNRNQVRDNRIGISANGTSIPNGKFGVQVARTAKYETVGPNNIIANNAHAIDVLDDGTDFVTITQNSIYNASWLGIDLGPITGVTPNDNGDADAGSNDGLNFPVLTSATTTQVTGTACADSVVPQPCRIEVFAAEPKTMDKGGGNYGQGKTFVGSGTTNSSGSFAVALSGVTAGQYLTATAIDATGNTSEFSRNILVSSGDGDTVGVFRPSNGVLFLKNTNATGYADIAINYGQGGDYPIAGDWDGNGTDTIGIYRAGSFYLRNANTIGYADIVFPFGTGTAGDQPIAGDWDGDGVDTIGVYNSNTITFYLRNSNTAGPADYVFRLGIPGDIGIAGDWTSKGFDTVGVFRPSNGVIFLKNTNQTGYADIVINYGIGGDKPVTGDWDGNGTDTIGVLRGNMFYLRDSNTVGYADKSFALGIPGDMPIAGNWDGIP